MPLRAVTFDFHNTLAECDEWFQLEIREIVPSLLDWLAARGGAPVTNANRDDAVRHYRKLRLEIMDHGVERDAYDCANDVLGLLGLVVDRKTVRLGIDDVMRGALAGSRPVNGVVEAVRQLREHGLELAVVSSAVHHEFLEWSLDKFGIRDCFSFVVTSADCGFYKSRTEIYTHTLDRLNVVAADAVHVGDSFRYDIETATRSGMRTVWFSRAAGEGNRNGAGLTVTSLKGLAPLILDHFGTER